MCGNRSIRFKGTATGCLALTNDLTDSSVPATGTGFYYLVRPDCLAAPGGAFDAPIGDVVVALREAHEAAAMT